VLCCVNDASFGGFIARISSVIKFLCLNECTQMDIHTTWENMAGWEAGADTKSWAWQSGRTEYRRYTFFLAPGSMALPSNGLETSLVYFGHLRKGKLTCLSNFLSLVY